MLAVVMPAAFQYVQEALNIGVDIGVRVLQRVAHTRLRGKMHHLGKAVLRKQRFRGCAIRKIERSPWIDRT